MFSRILSTVFFAAVALALWQIFGKGTSQSFFETMWSVFYGVVNSLASVMVEAFNTVVTVKK